MQKGRREWKGDRNKRMKEERKEKREGRERGEGDGERSKGGKEK